MDLSSLWAYQEVDMQYEKHEASLKKSSARRTALKLRAFINEQGEYRTQCETAYEGLQKQLTDLQVESARLAAEANKRTFTPNSEMSLEEIKPQLDALQEVLQQMEGVDARLLALIAQIEAQEQRLTEQQQTIPQAKKEYAQAKEKFDAEMAEAAPTLEALKTQRDELAKAVDEALLKRYLRIRQTRMPPLARINGDQCVGCGMQLPSAVVRKMKTADMLLECENCGRILSGG